MTAGGILREKGRYGRKPREDKDTLAIPKCPFCNEPFEAPEVIRTDFSQILGGHCRQCGAAFVCDESGKNLGEVYVDALVLATGGDWDRAMTLCPGEDYEEASFEYRSATHTVPVAKPQGRFQMSEKVVFVRLKKAEGE